MKSSLIIFLAMVMLVSKTIVAQQQQVDSIEWRIAAELPATNGQATALGLAGPVIGVHENVLLVAGGANFPGSMPWLGGKKKYYDKVYVFKKKNNKVQILSKSYKLPFPIAYAAVVSAPQGVIYAGGENDNGLSDRVILVQWDAARETVVIKNLPGLPVAVTNAAATLNGNRLYVAGGETATSVTDQFLSLDLNNLSEGWEQLPPVHAEVSHTVLAVQSNGEGRSVYLLGGRKKNAGSASDLYASVYEFDLTSKTWKVKKSLPYALSAGAGLAIGSSDIWMLGGDKGATFHKTELLIAAISLEKDAAKKQALILEKNKLQATHPGFSNEVLRFNTLTGEWSTAGSIPFDVPVTTTACQWGADLIIASGEIRAGVRTPRVLAGKFK
ncbi:MAG: hypothetical protein Q7T76_21660 [Ferruginibacter sp.]|nr:hypothetical protein [Ferruginibacter sp.]